MRAGRLPGVKDTQRGNGPAQPADDAGVMLGRVAGRAGG